MGETANLLQLFVFDTASFEMWKVSSRQKIRQEFSAVKVRLRLESLSIPPAAVDKERYRVLSERVAHVHPETTPNHITFWGFLLLVPSYKMKVCWSALTNSQYHCP